MNEKELLKARITISGFLKNRREELGITQTQLAEMTGMGIATIKRFESGKFWLNLKQYILLRHALQLPVTF
jgi:transcriptional regulator with XRE-family HTH domain